VIYSFSKSNRAIVKTIPFLDGRYIVRYIKLDLRYCFSLMKNFLTSLIFSFSCLLVSAQQDRFIYLQTENHQPFFVKLNNKVFNSYPLGYLIIPRLDEGLYSLVVGFPGSDYEQEFNCPVRNKDVGFIIKNTGEKQWQLFNVQTNAVIVPGDVITKPVIVYEKETDPFSVMLANAVHDSTILRKDVAKEVVTEKPAELIKDTAQIIVSNDAVSKTNNPDSAANVAKEVVTEKTELVPKNTADSLNTAVATTSNNAVSDSSRNVAKEIVTELPPKDTAIAVTPPVVITDRENILKTNTTTNNDVTKGTIEKKPDEVVQKDSSLAITPTDVALTRSQKRKAKKNEKALKDSSLVQGETVKVIPEAINENKDSARSAPSNNDLAVLKSTIRRRSRKTNRDGMELMYVDTYGDVKDTIRILIPSEKKEKKDQEINTEPVVITPVQDDNKKTGDDAAKKPKDKLSDEEKKIIQEANKEPLTKSAMINSDCKNLATEEDFLKTRKKMVAENNDEDMIKAAKKIFKTRCFTTEQIKNLSVLFLKDEGKYMFFDAAYPFASDSDLYPSLENQLTDAYYITRFRAMIHK